MITVSDRLVYWKDSLTVISKHIFAGVGLGNFSIEGSTYAYNSYLQFFAETGILGFVSLLGIAFIFIKNGSKKIRNSKDYLLISLFVAGTAFLFQNILDFSFFITQISFLWWMALGFVLSEDK
jgi:O-antigen ligase